MMRLLAGNLEWVVTYYETAEDAQNATNPIETPEAYTNTSIAGNAANPQTLFVSVANLEELSSLYHTNHTCAS